MAKGFIEKLHSKPDNQNVLEPDTVVGNGLRTIDLSRPYGTKIMPVLTGLTSP